VVWCDACEMSGVVSQRKMEQKARAKLLQIKGTHRKIRVTQTQVCVCVCVCVCVSVCVCVCVCLF